MVNDYHAQFGNGDSRLAMATKMKVANRPNKRSADDLQRQDAAAAALPSIAIDRAWIYAISPALALVEWEGGFSGKWCAFRHSGAIDDAWVAVRKAVEQDRLSLAKVSTQPVAQMHGNIHVICVYTGDWRDCAAITAARDVLRELGFKEELGYKRDIETRLGVYGGPGEWYRRA